MAVRRSELLGGIVATRYYGEGLKDLATATIAGLVAGLIVARFADWSPTFVGWWMVVTITGLALAVFAYGNVLIVVAALREKAAESQEHAIAVRMWKILAWLVLLTMLALSIGSWLNRPTGSRVIIPLAPACGPVWV